MNKIIFASLVTILSSFALASTADTLSTTYHPILTKVQKFKRHSAYKNTMTQQAEGYTDFSGNWNGICTILDWGTGTTFPISFTIQNTADSITIGSNDDNQVDTTLPGDLMGASNREIPFNFLYKYSIEVQQEKLAITSKFNWKEDRTKIKFQVISHIDHENQQPFLFVSQNTLSMMLNDQLKWEAFILIDDPDEIGLAHEFFDCVLDRVA